MTKITMSHFVAVYGSLKKGFYNHYFLENASFVSEGKVYGFSMYDCGPYPMIARTMKKGNGTVAVEVYAIDDNILQSLDRLEGCPNFYKRSYVTVETEGHPVRSWIYFGDQNQVRGLKVIENGVWQNFQDR